jgi:hypothetical protein
VQPGDAAITFADVVPWLLAAVAVATALGWYIVFVQRRRR